MAELKILFLCEGLTESSVVAQPWKHVFEIAKRTMQRGNNVQIITDKVQDTRSEEKIDGLSVRRIKKGMLSFDQNELLGTLNDENVDVINWHGSDTWSALRFSHLRKSLLKDVVWTLHSGVLSLNDLRNLEVSDYFQLYKFWNNMANAVVPKMFVRRWTHVPFLRRIITLSKRTAAELNECRIKQKITYVPSGVDTHVFKQSNDLVEEPVLLYFGPLSSFRGVDTLLSAFKTVREHEPSAKLVLLAREVDETNSWFRKIRKTENVELIAEILTQKELTNYLRSAAVVVLPFRFWPQVECPLTILEAMATGKALITTSIGAIPEIVSNSENGVLVSPKNSKALAKAMVELLRDVEKRELLGKNARAYVEHFHEWDVIVAQTLDILKSSIEEK